MMSQEDIIDMPPEERLALISALWESLGDAAPLPIAQETELMRRMQSFEQDRGGAEPWEALKQELVRRVE